MSISKPFVYGLPILTVISFSQCMNDCSSTDPGLYSQFFFRDKTTGKPYYEVSPDHPDSLRLYLEFPIGETPVLYHDITKHLVKNEGYGFGLVDLYSYENLKFFSLQST